MATTPRLGRRLSRSLALFAALAFSAGLIPGQAPATGSETPASAARPLPPFTAQVEGAQRTATGAAPQDAPRNAAWAALRATLTDYTASAHRHADWSQPAPAKPAVKEPAKTKPAKTKPAPAPTKAAPTVHKQKYVGTNHFWIPSLGMSYSVHYYACSRTRDPANYIYRWGCAGRNNVYLLGHAWGVMKPLHDLYVRGGLRRGMIAVYADASGRVRKYQVTAWRVALPTEIEWQIAAQPVPSLTLQTCLGKYSQYRLNVRLVAVR
jgi:hypothetical protein